MSVAVKICGLRDAASVAAAIEGGARYAGFVFFGKSPRVVDAATAAALIAQIPGDVIPVGLFVDPTDEELTSILKIAPLRMIQLHGDETPQRVAAVKKWTGLPVMKAVGIATAQDIALAQSYEDAADFLLLDAKPPKDSLPGGNARTFDWSLLANLSLTKPWMLAGGLTEMNIAEAAATTGALILDVSSGVEEAMARKSPSKIKAFLARAAQIETCC